MNIFPNIIAMISTLIAMILLGMIVPKIGGSLGKMLKMMIVGIFFSVFVHAGFELAEVFGLLGEDVLLPTMGILLTFGSLAFIYAGWVGLKSIE